MENTDGWSIAADLAFPSMEEMGWQVDAIAWRECLAGGRGSKRMNCGGTAKRSKASGLTGAVNQDEGPGGREGGG